MIPIKKLLLKGISLNYAYCRKVLKRWHHLRRHGIRLKQVSASWSGEKMAMSDVRAEQRIVIEFYESGMTPLDTLK